MTLKVKRVTPDVSVAPQPDINCDFDEIKAKGYKSVLNLRDRKEKGYVEEDAVCTKLGLEYKNYEVFKASDLTKDKAYEIMGLIEEMPKPIFVHCYCGFSAAVVVLTKVAIDTNESADKVLEWGSSMSYNFAKDAQVYSVIQEALKF
eukprot:GFYU01031441.1.p1 GENE.GFYU01031441.1~~GFYU01031441.1.p1  ORF type:complete len:147 (-),score=27.44 GFYU01031441.1:84-524(-)